MLAALLVVAAPGASAYAEQPSESCGYYNTYDWTTGVRGYINTTPVILEIENNLPDVCYRFGNTGGRLKVTYPAVTPGAPPQVVIPRLDSQSRACTTAAGNGIPGPHPAFNGAVDAYSFWFDSYKSASELWFCGELGPLKARVQLTTPSAPFPSIQRPQVMNEPDTAYGPIELPYLALNSHGGYCRSVHVSGQHTPLADLWARVQTAEYEAYEARLQLALKSTSYSQTLCFGVRLNGQLTSGKLEFNSGSPTPPDVYVFPSWLRCEGPDMKNVFTNDQTGLQLTRSDYDPATESIQVCVALADPSRPGQYLYRQRIMVQDKSTPPSVEFSRD
jgi:hypothetical protein